MIDWIGKQTENIILSVNEESQLAVAILLILWVSAIASAFVDNIPLTTMMVKIAISLAENEALDLPLQPLVWALAFGACLGGKSVESRGKECVPLFPHPELCVSSTHRVCLLRIF